RARALRPRDRRPERERDRRRGLERRAPGVHVRELLVPPALAGGQRGDRRRRQPLRRGRGLLADRRVPPADLFEPLREPYALSAAAERGAARKRRARARPAARDVRGRARGRRTALRGRLDARRRVERLRGEADRRTGRLRDRRRRHGGRPGSGGRRPGTPLAGDRRPRASRHGGCARAVPVYWGDDPSTQVTTIAVPAWDPVGRKLWIADGNRVLRIANAGRVGTGEKLLVDLVVGQVAKGANDCNQGFSSPAASRLCVASEVQFDPSGNLYVVENAYECHGNNRITVFTAADIAAAQGLF